jgi:GR25 family glycosyltransferase involved in LPS biosynthesis
VTAKTTPGKTTPGRTTPGIITPGEITLGEIGCTLSHLIAIQTSYHRGDSSCLVLEDDAYLGFIPWWDKPLAEICQDLPKSWELLQMFTGNPQCNHDIVANESVLNINETMKEHRRCSGAVAYLINRRGMERILKLVTPGCPSKFTLPYLGVRFISDWYLYRIVRYYGYTIFPLICPFNATLVSNIGNTKTLAVRDFTHLDNCLLIYRHYARRLLPKLSTGESS